MRSFQIETTFQMTCTIKLIYTPQGLQLQPLLHLLQRHPHLLLLHLLVVYHVKILLSALELPRQTETLSHAAVIGSPINQPIWGVSLKVWQINVLQRVTHAQLVWILHFVSVLSSLIKVWSQEIVAGLPTGELMQDAELMGWNIHAVRHATIVRCLVVLIQYSQPDVHVVSKI